MKGISIAIPKDVEHIIYVLEKNGHEAFAVGGCVRDAIMGRVPHDWDITTSAKPEEVKALFKRTIDTGIQHGTVTVLENHIGYEVTTYRIDGTYSDGRHPEKVTFTSNLVEDLKRRDFTINAMAYNHRVGIVDAFGGIDDLQQGIIRCVGVATERFTEDALRILRAIRFSAQLDFSIEADTATAITALAANLTKISRERIQTELDKLLTSDHPDRITLVNTYGLGQYIFEGSSMLSTADDAGYQQISHVMTSLPADHYLRFAALLMYEEQPKHVLKKLKFDNNTIDICGRLCAIKSVALPTDKPSLRRAIVKYGRDIFDDYAFIFLETLQAAGSYQLLSSDELSYARQLYNEIISDGDCISIKDMSINGSDLIALGVPQGKALGHILNTLFEQVLDDPTINDRETLLALVSPVA